MFRDGFLSEGRGLQCVGGQERRRDGPAQGQPGARRHPLRAARGAVRASTASRSSCGACRGTRCSQPTSCCFPAPPRKCCRSPGWTGRLLETASPAPSTRSCTPAISVRSTAPCHDHIRSAPKTPCIEYPSRFPIKVMGANVDGFVHAVTMIARQFDPDFDAATCRAARQQGRQLPGRHHHGHRDQPRAARRAVPHAVDPPDGQGRPVAMDAVSRAGGWTTCLPTRRCRRSPRRATQSTPDELWLCEHPPVFTQGLAGRPEHVLEAGGIPVVATQSRRAGHLSRARPGGGLPAGGLATRRLLHQGICLSHRGGGDPHAWLISA